MKARPRVTKLRPSPPAAPQEPEFCPVAPAAKIRIRQLSREFELWFHLCETCLEAKKIEGWQVRVNRAPPHDGLSCDVCGETEAVT